MEQSDLFDDHLRYPVSKSHAAFLMTVRQLFTDYPKIYFWTFTFKAVYHDWQYSGLWARIIKEVAYHYRGEGFFCGVRVLEAHKEHGLHYHALLNVRIPVEMVRRIGERWGLGRIHVQRATPESAFYLGKYLTKDETKLYRGIARWATVGGYCGVKVKDVELRSNAVDAVRAFSDKLGQLDFRLTRIIFTFATMFGPIASWEFDTRQKFLRHANALARSQAWFNDVCSVVHGTMRIYHDKSKRMNRLNPEVEDEQDADYKFVPRNPYEHGRLLYVRKDLTNVPSSGIMSFVRKSEGKP
jgi:hypothetical protein